VSRSDNDQYDGRSEGRKATPDEVLVVAAILGDLKAFNELVIRYAHAVLRVVRGIVKEAFAEDIAQESWLLAFKALPSIDDPSKFASWLMAITRNRALRFKEKENRRSSHRVAYDGFLIEQFSALQQPMSARFEEKDYVQQALDQLPEEISMVLRLKFYDGLPLKRIGAFLDIPESTVKWRIHRGKQLLREQFQTHE